MPQSYTAVIDGASRGNPGPAAIGVLIYDADGNLVKKYHKFLGQATNNAAEYRALLSCLEEVAALGGKQVTIYSDSQLLVRQFNGEYRIKNKALKKLAEKVRNTIARHGLQVEMVHVPRSETKEADRLANISLNLAGH
ncbi:MAG TPA: ribonuclease HI family protein [Bacteroidetes bacterium]|nr:ribonuclease HI family protein [Bacteroidota bacterium]